MSLNNSVIRCPRRMPHLCISSIMKCYFNKISHLSIAHSRDHSWRIRWISVVLSCLFLIINAEQVKAILPEPEAGWMVTKGDRIVKYGDNLQIWCNLNETFVDKKYPGANSSNIYFMNNKDRIEEKFITRINKTTALLNIKSPPAGYFVYFCGLDLPNGEDVTVCLNAVTVAYEPQLPSNFTCRSYNWESLTCAWDVSEHYVLTTHILFYIVHTEGRQKFVPCPIAKAKDYSCTWTKYTNPIYRQTQENYTFVMKIRNMFGMKSFVHATIDHFSIVIPAKPAYLSVTNETSDSATLCWKSPFPMNNFPPGLTHKIMYLSYWDYKKGWKIINIDTEPHLHKRCFTLTGLYANSEYDAHVYIRSSKAVGEDMYSKPAAITFSTLPTLPSFPPQTDIGSFEIVENNGIRDVYLYWQMIQEYHENGNKFKYWINHVEENDHKIVLEPIEITKSYAKFGGLSFNKYRFKIVSQNEIGISKNYTEIIVPSRDKMPHGPIEFTVMAFGNGLYELSWVPPMIYKDITNYTIFWCDNIRDRPYQCTGYLNWKHVSMNTTVYNITVPDWNKIYQFAISANTNKGSSGMIWSSCTIRSKVLDRMKFIWINRFGLDFIEVGWYFDCLDHIGVIEEIKIYYCPIVSVSNIKCEKYKRNYIRVKYDPYRSYGIVKNLMPYTTYKLELTMVTKNGESQHSKTLYQTTYETASSSSS